MTNRMFRVGQNWVNLGFVVWFEVQPGYDWSDDEDEKRPSLYVQFLTNNGVRLHEREAVAQGYADIAALEAALIKAMEAFANG